MRGVLKASEESGASCSSAQVAMTVSSAFFLWSFEADKRDEPKETSQTFMCGWPSRISPILFKHSLVTAWSSCGEVSSILLTATFDGRRMR